MGHGTLLPGFQDDGRNSPVQPETRGFLDRRMQNGLTSQQESRQTLTVLGGQKQLSAEMKGGSATLLAGNRHGYDSAGRRLVRAEAETRRDFLLALLTFRANFVSSPVSSLITANCPLSSRCI